MTCTSGSASAQATASRISPGMRLSMALRRSGRSRRSRAMRGRAGSLSMSRLLKVGTRTPSRRHALQGLVRREAVDAGVATGRLERVDAAAARLVRRVPRFRRNAVVETGAVAVAEHGRALAALGPVAAGRVDGAGDGGAVGLRAGQDVVHVGRVAAAVDDLAFLGQGGLLVQVV